MQALLTINGSTYLSAASTVTVTRHWLRQRAGVAPGPGVQIFLLWPGEEQPSLFQDNWLTTSVPVSIWVTPLPAMPVNRTEQPLLNFGDQHEEDPDCISTHSF